MLTFNIVACVVLVAIVAGDKDAGGKPETCDAADQTVKLLCQVLDESFKQQDGKLAKMVCQCSAAFLKKDYSLCTAQESDFTAAPKCGKLYKSEAYKKLSAKDDHNLVRDYMVDVAFGQIYKVCNETDQHKLLKRAETFFSPGPVSYSMNFLFAHNFTAETAVLLNGCYGQLIDLPQDDD